ncbi:MAG: LysR family transcriptional regulator [Gammaproteobacteria bacterium]|nr:LysR family transcriptional regulator [Gammaproteobacteria bacterium]
MLSRQLLRIDLNLLVALQILMEERSVTRAAERLSVSQPALSKTLQKLRDTFEDELFTRTAHGLIPTPRAEELGAKLPDAMELLDDLLKPTEFDPSTYQGIFRLALPPLFAEVLLPVLMETLMQEAPGMHLLSGDVSADFQERLKQAEIDFAISVVTDTDRDVHAEPLRTISPRCYMRRGHPLVDKKMTLKEFLAYPHVRLYLPGLSRENISLVDEVLGERELYREIVLETTQFAPAIGVLARTDCLLVANMGLANSPSLEDHIAVQPIPDELKRLFSGHSGVNRSRLALLRHTRTSNSEPHQWLRQQITDHMSRLDTLGEPGSKSKSRSRSRSKS